MQLARTRVCGWVYVSICLACSPAGAALPPDFGRQQLQQAIEARGLKPERFNVVTEHSMVLPADGFSIQGHLIRGGNLRGIMYGLLEAAAQIRAAGGLKSVQAAPALAVRGVRWVRPLPADPALLFQALARARFNRFVVADSGLSAAELRRAAEAAASCGIDFGIAPGAEGALRDLIAGIPQLKSVEAQPNEANLRDLTSAGRLLTLDLDGTNLTEEGLEAARLSHLPLQVAVKPGQFGDFLRKPEVSQRSRPWQVIWRLDAGFTAGPETVRSAVPWLSRSGAQGFEIEVSSSPPPLFFELWGRLSYNPKEPDSLFLAQLNLPAARGVEALQALDAAAALPPVRQMQLLSNLLDSPAADPWQASPNEAARLALAGVAAAKSRPLERVSRFEQAARKLESASGFLPELKPLAVQARIAALRLAAADHLAWAKAAGDPGALAAAIQETEAAQALEPESPVLRLDLEQLRALHIRQTDQPIPSRHPRSVARPAVTHQPPARVMPGQPLVLALKVWPVVNIRTVRLHWRPMNSSLQWRVLESAPSRPVFIVPASEVTAARDIEYFFEVLHTLGSGWFLPELRPGIGWQTYVAETAVSAGEMSGEDKRQG